MHQVQSWVAHRRHTLHSCTGQMVREQSWSDDRLALVLDALAETATWQHFERALNERIIRVYHLKPQQVRLDSTTASGYCTVTEEGLFQFGYRKDHRPDLLQLKVMLSALDPLGLPIATHVVAGKVVDDPLYIPAREQVKERAVRAGGKRPASVRFERSMSLHPVVDDTAVQAATRWFGWRVYATNHPTEGLPLAQAVLAYREEYLVERGFGRLKGKPLSLAPMDVRSDQRATGLTHLLSLGLRILTLLEFSARQHVADRHETLPGLYAGNPKRTTSCPTAEALLEAFRQIHLSVVMLGQQLQLHHHVTPLSELQKHILYSFQAGMICYRATKCVSKPTCLLI